MPTIARCPNGMAIEPPGMSIFSGSSEDKGGAFYTVPKDKVDFNSGYYIGKDDKILMLGDIVNYTDEDKEIYTVTDLQHIEGRPPGTLDSITQLWSINLCDGIMGFLNPPKLDGGKFSIKSQEMKIQQDGYLIGGHGHLYGKFRGSDRLAWV
jgi:hypothetical protein